jgi:N-acetylglucosaminyldiphosphoundecaprenol N-acetyl-beta-D-mannosaminyltransferase
VRILGLDFFEGTAAQAVDRALHRRGLIVAPSGTCFTRLQHDPTYRAAMTTADQVLPDSGLMVLLWRFVRGDRLNRISGLAYLKELLARPDLRSTESTVWVLPDHYAQDKTNSWLRENGFVTNSTSFYVAPIYGSRIEDPVLLELIQSQRPSHVIIAHVDLACAIHCIGGALGFITGYQVAIPAWADRLYLGWLFRLVTNPRKFMPRAISAFSLPSLIRKYGEELPPLIRS